MLQAFDDGLRDARPRENTQVRLRDERNAARFKPVDCVAGLPAVEGADEFARAARVTPGEFAWVETSASDIAASAAGDANLGERMRGGFEEGDFGGRAVLRARLGASDRGKITGCAAACDYDA